MARSPALSLERICRIAVLVCSAATAASPASAFPPREIAPNDFRISFQGANGDTSIAAGGPAVAWNSADDEYLVIWTGGDFWGETEIFGQRLDGTTGAPLGGGFRISDMGPDEDSNFWASRARVAYNPTANEYLVVWLGDDGTPPLADDEWEIFGQRLTASGSEIGANDFRISDMGPDGDPDYDARGPFLTYNATADEYLVVWAGDDDTAPLFDEDFEIFGQRLTGAGSEIGPNDFRISQTGPDGAFGWFSQNPSVSYNPTADEYLVVWNGVLSLTAQEDSPLELEIFGQRLSAAGSEVGANDFRISDMGADGDGTFTAIQANVSYNPAADEYLVVWAGNPDAPPLALRDFEILGQRLTASGSEVGANDFPISEVPSLPPSYFAIQPEVTYESVADEYVVVWYANPDTDAQGNQQEWDIYGQRLAASGSQVGANDFRISDMGPDGEDEFDGWSPSLAYNATDNETLVVWSGDDDIPPLVKNEFEIFGQRLGIPSIPALPGPRALLLVAAGVAWWAVRSLRASAGS